jgi:hypothetical protein
VKVICRRKGNVIATVDPDGEFLAWTIEDWDLEKIQRLVKRDGPPEDDAGLSPRLQPEREEVRVNVFSSQAERYQIDSKWWGNLPAWCRRCGGTHLVGVEDLRTGVRAGSREVLVEGETVR